MITVVVVVVGGSVVVVVVVVVVGGATSETDSQKYQSTRAYRNFLVYLEAQ